jgi:serine/threonine protein kinase
MTHPIHANVEPIPGYRLIERLGRGGYGEVWKAEAPGGMHKAIKFVSGDVDDIGDDGKAAEQEYRSLSRVRTIRHPFLLSIERFEVIEGQLVIVMELADRNLWDRFTECVRQGLAGVPRPELLRYMEEASEALDLMNLHHQIQHLDVKPHNIFLVHQHVKVADFGLAKDLEGTRADLTGGVTPTYAPPETFEGWVSRQSDQYSLAIVYMEMLTGCRPFNGTSTRQLIFQHLTMAPDLSALPPADRDVVGKALSKKPDDRFATCAELVRALRGEDRSRTPVPPTPVDLPATPPDTDGPRCPTRFTPVKPRPSYPALVTPTSKHSVATGSLRDRRASAETTPRTAGPAPERTGDGILFPALIVGVGQFGISIVRDLRQLVAERFGSPTLPHFRWLCIDTDQAVAEAALSGPESTALSADSVLLTRLQRPGHYLSRDGMPAVDTWLPPEELFKMPRTPATDGIRGLGRLALCDHYHVVCHRIRIALEPFLDPAAIDEAVRMTGLGLRSTRPRIYLATSLAGGTGSGMFLDLAYLVRRVAKQLGFGSPQIVGLLGVPTFAQPGDRQGLANARAALTELHHFGCTRAGYRAHFDTREGPLADPEQPFRRCVLVPIASRFDPEAAARAVGVAAQAALNDLLTPLGPVAHPDGDDPAAARFVVPGIRRLAWPRAAVVRAAGWLLARRTLQSWAAKSAGEPTEAAEAFVESLWAERVFDRSAIGPEVERRVVELLRREPSELVDERMEQAASSSRHGGTEVEIARTAIIALTELLGRPAHDDSEYSHELGRALAQAVREVAAKADSRIGSAILSLIEQPGLRVAGADDAIRLIRQRLTEEVAAADHHAAGVDEAAIAQNLALQNQLTPKAGSAGSGPPRPEGGLIESLREWAHTRTRALLARACSNVYRALLGSLPDHIRELTSIRNQMTALVAQLDADPPALPAMGGVLSAIFPNADGTPAEAAAQLVVGLDPADVREFEHGFQARARHEFRGIAAVCNRPREQGRTFLKAILEQASRFLDLRTPIMTASQVLALQNTDEDALKVKASELVARGAPRALDRERALLPMLTVLGAPTDEAAAQLTSLIQNLLPNTTFRAAKTDGDVILYQETAVSLATLPHLTAELPGPIEPGSRSGTTHARTDVAWTPVGTG